MKWGTSRGRRQQERLALLSVPEVRMCGSAVGLGWRVHVSEVEWQVGGWPLVQQ
jgi:hypothetical protein